MSPDGQVPPFAPPVQPHPLRYTGFLLGTVLVVGLLISYQLSVTLLAPSWADPATGWLRMALAWPEVFLLLLLSWWLTGIHRLEALTWWLLAVAMLGYAIGKTLLVVFTQVVYPRQVPFPWWSDFFYLLTLPCFFLAPVFWPGVQVKRPSGLSRTKLVLDTLLVMSAAMALSWYFILAPIFTSSAESSLGRGVTLAYPVGDLGGLFVLCVLLLRPNHWYGHRPILSLLMVAALCLILADSWMAWLHLHPRYQQGYVPDLLFLIASLLLPLAGLMQFRAAWHKPALPTAAQVQAHTAGNVKPQEFLESLRFLFPFVMVLLACVGIGVHLLIAPFSARGALVPLVVMLALLLLVLVRQGVAFVEQAQLRREREAARVRELALSESNRQMETFISMASHELKTPLTVMTLHQQQALRRLQRLRPEVSSTPPDVVQAVQRCEHDLLGTAAQLQRQGRLINELLDISRIQVGRLALHMERGDLQAVVRAMVEEHREVWPERSIQLCLSSEYAVPIEADHERLGQVVTNYLTNALRYSTEDRPVEVGVRVEGQEGRVWVRDQGPGLPPEECERIWERFYQAPGILIQSGSGVGLGIGLYLSKTIVEQHQGQVGVQSMPGAGSTFWFMLPLARSTKREQDNTEDDWGHAPHRLEPGS